MRLDFSENAITAKVHALYGRRLTRSQYEELCRKKNTSEIASYLKERTHLSELLTSVQPATVRSDSWKICCERAVIISIWTWSSMRRPKIGSFTAAMYWDCWRSS